MDMTCHRVFIGGDKSQVGKTSVCLGLLSSLIRQGVDPRLLGYIKPSTQCESVQLISKYCNEVGIECVGIGPLVFYSGFTRAFLNGETESREQIIGNITSAVDKLCEGKRFVIIDGVGYPAVGSIIGVCNAVIAKALSCEVILVGKQGVGDAVDSFNLNAAYFESFGVNVIGAIFNKLPLEGYYSVEKCKEAVSQYFSVARPSVSLYGFIPSLPTLSNASPPPPPPSTARDDVASMRASSDGVILTDKDRATVAEWTTVFTSHVDIDLFIRDITKNKAEGTCDSLPSTSLAPPPIITPLPAPPSVVAGETELDRLESSLAFKVNMDYATPQAREAALAPLRERIATLREKNTGATIRLPKPSTSSTASKVSIKSTDSTEPLTAETIRARVTAAAKAEGADCGG